MAAAFAIPPEPPRLSLRQSNAIFARLRSLSDNKRCFCCSARNPMWASLAQGIFMCIQCAGGHRAVMWRGRGSTRSCTLDTWDQEQMLRMVCGGNARAQVFWAKKAIWPPRCERCSNVDAVLRCVSCELRLCSDCNAIVHIDSSSTACPFPAVPLAKNAPSKASSFFDPVGQAYQTSLDEEVAKQREKILPTLNEQFGLDSVELNDEAAEPVLAASAPPPAPSSSGPLSSVLSLFRDE